MTQTDTKAEIIKAQNKILNCVSEALQELQEKTGCYVQDLDIAMIDITSIGDNGKRCVVGPCTITVAA